MMKAAAKKIKVAAALFLAAGIIAGVAVRATAAPRTLKRETDPVIISGADLPSLLGMPIDRIGAFAADPSGSLAQIPFQIDERDSSGALVFPFGPKKNKDSDTSFDANDELIFMARDAGASAVKLAPPPGAGRTHEIALRDPVDGGAAWVYVFAFDAAPPRSDVDYVSMSSDGLRITARNYSTSFCKDAPIGFCRLSLSEKGGGNGANYMDRLKVRATAKLRVVGAKMNKNESSFTSEILAWIDGPARVIRRTNNKMILFWKIPTPGSVIDNVYYADSFIYPTEVDVPFDIGSLLEEFNFRVYTDHNKNAKGKIFLNTENPEPVKIDGEMSAAEKKLDLSPYEWMFIGGAAPGARGGWINRLFFDEGIKAKPYLFYMDDASKPDPPESERGMIGAIGYDVRYMETLTKGVWKLTSHMYNAPDFKPGSGGEKIYLDILDNPIKVVVK